MPYSTEQEVYEATGMNTDIVQELSEKDSTEVTTLIGTYIAKADRDIKRKLGLPTKIRKEEHVGDGKTNNIELGPWEDSIGMHDYDPTNCVENVYAVYVNGRRVRLPYPRDCDSLSEDNYADFTYSSCTITEETTTIRCGSKSIKMVFLAGGYAELVLSALKNIHPWDYIGFWFYSSSASATFTFRLYDKDGNYNSKTFTCPVANRWTFIRLYIEEFSGDIEWEDTDCYAFRIYSDTGATCYFDNFNLNDGWWWTYPLGYLNYGKISSDEGWVGEGDFIEVTYDFDPYKVTVPEDIASISAKLAGVRLLNYLLGSKYRSVGFEIGSKELDDKVDRYSMEITRKRLEREAAEELAAIGYKAYTGLT